MAATSLGGRLRSPGLVLAVLLTLAACDHPDNGLTKEDYRDLATRTPPAPAAGAQAQSEPPIPELQPILAAPPPPALEQRLVSVNVPDPDVPLRDVLIELARKVGVDLDLDPKIAGGVIIYAKDRPFSEVIDRICDMANLRYTFKDNVLRVEIDTMYNRDYRVDLPNATRTAKMSVATSTDVFSAVQGSGSSNGSNNSASSVDSQSTNDSWREIETNLRQILVNSYPKSQPIDSNLINGPATVTAVPAVPAVPASSPKPPGPANVAPGVPVTPPPGATASPQVNAAPAPANAASPAAPTSVSNFSASNEATSNQSTEGGGDNSGGATANGTTAGSTAAGGAGQNVATSPSVPLSAIAQLAQIQQSMINQAIGPAAVPVVPAQPPVGIANGAATPAAFFSINKSAGIVSVFGTSKQQKLVQEYLSRVVAEANAQVLIEAKVVEVDLNDQYKSGIDWQRAISAGGGTFSFGTQPSGSGGFLGDQANFAKQALSNATANAFTLSWNGTNFSSLLNFVEGFGTTRTLSSPRITALNNQTAVLKVAQNQVYFSLTATVTSTPASAGSVASQTATYSSQLHTVPIGVVMTVQPQIDTERNTVTLNLRPTVSVHSGDVSDPAVALSLASACGSSVVGACSPTNISSAVTNSNVPIVEVREMDSVVTVPSGNIVVMGGLMQSTAQKQNTAVPGAGDLPLIGNLFKVQSHETDVTELVIFLKASIVHGGDSVDWADKDLYKRYIQDPRPLAF